jgi:cytosine/adenosine deaminase-related metal-dependent hydrolase
VGKDFDALVINMNVGPSELMKDDYSVAELVQKFVYLADDRNISQIYVAGKLINI